MQNDKTYEDSIALTFDGKSTDYLLNEFEETANPLVAWNWLVKVGTVWQRLMNNSSLRNQPYIGGKTKVGTKQSCILLITLTK